LDIIDDADDITPEDAVALLQFIREQEAQAGT
jgi:hypothetical protein